MSEMMMMLTITCVREDEGNRRLAEEIVRRFWLVLAFSALKDRAEVGHIARVAL